MHFTEISADHLGELADTDHLRACELARLGGLWSDALGANEYLRRDKLHLARMTVETALGRLAGEFIRAADCGNAFRPAWDAITSLTGIPELFAAIAHIAQLRGFTREEVETRAARYTPIPLMFSEDDA
jgi:hypothetical protein